jgi:hypothetical protein
VTLVDLISKIPNFDSWTYTDKIKVFGWYLHEYEEVERFAPSQIMGCFENASLEHPANVNSILTNLLGKKPKEILKDRRGYYLEKRIKDDLQSKYGQRQATIQADKALVELPLKIPEIAERIFLEEAIRCFRAQAFRAAIVMTWNLAYDHLCEYILKKHLTSFQAQWVITYPSHKKNPVVSKINKREDFEDLKESELIQVSKSASILSNDLFKIYNEKLGKRNTAAHPSLVEILPHTAEEFILDLVTNGVLKLN